MSNSILPRELAPASERGENTPIVIDSDRVPDEEPANDDASTAGSSLRRDRSANEGDDNAPPTHHTDLQNAKLFVREHGADIRYLAPTRTWYLWNGSVWRADDTGEIMARAKQTAARLWIRERARTDRDPDAAKKALAGASRLQSRQGLENMIALACSEPGVAVKVCQLDSDPWLFNVENGTVDLRTGELRPAKREDLITKIAPAAADMRARSELWNSFIDSLTNGDTELAAYVQRSRGYALFGAWREKAFWFGYGPPDAGKSTLLKIVGDIMGDYHRSVDAKTWMTRAYNDGPRGDIVRLRGVRLVTTSEVRPDAAFDTQLVKQVTGGDPLTAAAKYENEITFKPTFALWLCANNRPRISDEDEALWVRVQCVPFTNSIPKSKQDKTLSEKLTGPDHAPAVLAWLVAGCVEWSRVGIGSCKAVDGATAAYRRSMNQAVDFFDECIEVTADPSDMLATAVLRERYEGWCADNKEPSLKNKAYGARLRELGVAGGDDGSRVNGQRMWVGVRLRD